MLATIPITKTSASRMTPELRDNAAFGAVFSDHMLVADFAGGKWSEPRIIPHGAQPLAAAPACAHYGQGIFEGFKAFSAAQWRRGGVPSRRQSRAHGEDLPAHGDAGSAGVDLHRRHARARRSSIATGSPRRTSSALYVRPVLFATGETLGVKPSEIVPLRDRDLPERAVFLGLGGSDRRRHLRARVPGGTGAAKCGGNYAGSMLAALEAQKKGFHNVLWLDGIERSYVEEAGLMNVAFVIDGAVVTPPLGGTILPGITRDSVLTLLRDLKLPVEERRITHRRSVRGARQGHAAGRCRHRHRRRSSAPLGRLRHRIARSPIPADGRSTHR